MKGSSLRLAETVSWKPAKRRLDPFIPTYGMIQLNDVVFDTFTHHGWVWGGLWKKGTDYMHFRKEITDHYMVQRMTYRPDNINPKIPEQK